MKVSLTSPALARMTHLAQLPHLLTGPKPKQHRARVSDATAVDIDPCGDEDEDDPPVKTRTHVPFYRSPKLSAIREQD
jgi:hypothetical protein